jgi:hypothetical protein
MTITRTRLDKCKTKGCPFTPDEHDEWMQRCALAGGHDHRNDEPSHQHLPKRSQGGKNIVAILCWPLHSAIDNGATWENRVIAFDDGERRYRLWRRARDGRRIEPPVIDVQLAASSPVAEPSEERTMPRGDAGSATEQGAAIPAAVTPPQHSSSQPSPLTFRDNGIEAEPEYTLEDVRKAIERVKSEVTGRQWRAGDVVNLAEAWQEGWQYLDDLGYPEATLANYANVAKAYPIEDRRPLKFTFHQAVYKLPDRLWWLDAALMGDWDRETLRASACGPRNPRVKRWTLADLHICLEAWPGNASVRNNARRWAEAWLTWLEAE